MGRILLKNPWRRFRSKPFNLDRIVLAEFLAIMPQLEADICSTKCDLDNIFNAVILCPLIPPVSIFKLKHCEWETG